MECLLNDLYIEKRIEGTKYGAKYICGRPD